MCSQDRTCFCRTSIDEEPSWRSLLRELRKHVGGDKQREINEILEAAAELPATPPTAGLDLPVDLDPNLYVFISYTRPDQGVAEQVETYLLAAGICVLRDTNAIRSGADRDMTIEKALHETNRMVLSDSSMPYRKEVHREWFFYDQEQKPLHPVYTQKCRLHSRMYAYNYIDARADFNAAMARLLADLRRPFEPPSTTVGRDPILVLERGEATEVEARTVDQTLEALKAAVCGPFSRPDRATSRCHPPRQWLEQAWASRYPDLPPLDRLLGNDNVLLLLDALNEMPYRNADDYGEHIDSWRLSSKT